jgi:helicase
MPGDKSKIVKEIIEQLLKLKKWKDLNAIQKEAVKCGILDGKGNFLVFAPTAGGKTGIAELAMLQELLKGGKIIYAVPSHALIGDKLKDFQYLDYKFKVVEGGASFSSWKNSDVVITTFELLYRACLFSKEFLKDFKIVVVDEFHILYDDARGYNLEKLLTMLKETTARVFCISATFEDKQEAREWLNANVVEIPQQLREIPIEYYVIDLRKKGSDMASIIIKEKNEPYLIFCATKPYTKERAEEICKLLTTKKNDKEKLVQEMREITGREELPELETSLCNCLELGVGFHHSDLDSSIREYVAQLFIDRKIDYLFCTTGLAYGINFPARTVVVADLSLYDFEDKRSKPLPTHMFLQMAGRAGRPQFGDRGFCYVVVKKDDDLTLIDDYTSGNLTRARSHISQDDFFLKAVLELIYSKRNTETEITSFFQNSLFNFQASREKNLMVPFNLQERLATRMITLCNVGFVEQMGLQYMLTSFGKVTLEYLFSGLASPELAAFIRLNKYIEEHKSLEFSFDFVHFLSKNFSDCRISKQPRERANEIDVFLQNRGIADRTHPEYSAYAVYYKWIENVNELDIDKSCKVYSGNLPAKMREMSKLMQVSLKLAEAKNYPVSANYEVFRERVFYGVREEELPLVKIRGIKRELARDIKNYCDGILKTVHKYNGTCIEILEALLRKEGEKEFLRHMGTIQYIGSVRSQKLLDLIKANLDGKAAK